MVFEVVSEVQFPDLTGAGDGAGGGMVVVDGVIRALQVQARRRQSRVSAVGWGAENPGHPPHITRGRKDGIGRHGRQGNGNGMLRS